MAGYWPSILFFVLACSLTSSRSRSITQKHKEQGQYPAILERGYYYALYGFCL